MPLTPAPDVASHNALQDNGYRVCLGDGSQIVPPADAAVEDQHVLAWVILHGGAGSRRRRMAR